GAVQPVAQAIAVKPSETVVDLPLQAPRPVAAPKAVAAVVATLPKPEPERAPKPDRPTILTKEPERIVASKHPTRYLVAAAAVLTLIVSGGSLAAWRYLAPGAAGAVASGGKLVVNTDVPGAQVGVDGQVRGT